MKCGCQCNVLGLMDAKSEEWGFRWCVVSVMDCRTEELAESYEYQLSSSLDDCFFLLYTDKRRIIE